MQWRSGDREGGRQAARAAVGAAGSASRRARSWPWRTGCWRASPTCPTPTSRVGRGASAARRSRGSSATTPRWPSRSSRWASRPSRTTSRRAPRCCSPPTGSPTAWVATTSPRWPSRSARGPGCTASARTRPNRALAEALEYADAHEVASYRHYLLAMRAQNQLDLGRVGRPPSRTPAWCCGRASSRASSPIPALITVGLLQARRGDEDAGATLEEAWRWALRAGGVQRIAADGGRAHRARLAQRRPRRGAGAGRRRLPAGRRDRGAVVHR